MASGDTLLVWTAAAYEPVDWRYLAYTSGGTYEVLVGDTLTGATSSSTAVVVFVVLNTGTWAGGDAAGYFIVTAQSAAFASENLNVGANSNVATIGGNSTICCATLDKRRNHEVLDFDADTPEFGVFSGILPRHYAGGGVTAYLTYAMSNTTTNTVDWDAAFERIGEGQLDLDSDGWAAFNSVDATTVPGTSGLTDVVSIAFTDGADMDSVAVGEAFRLCISRDAPNDDAANDAELLAVELKET